MGEQEHVKQFLCMPLDGRAFLGLGWYLPSGMGQCEGGGSAVPIGSGFHAVWIAAMRIRAPRRRT